MNLDPNASLSPSSLLREEVSSNAPVVSYLFPEPLYEHFLAQEKEVSWWKQWCSSFLSLLFHYFPLNQGPAAKLGGLLSGEQINLYRRFFNQEDNHALILSADFGAPSDVLGKRNWTSKGEEGSHLLRWMLADHEEVLSPIQLLKRSASSAQQWVLNRQWLHARRVKRLVLPMCLKKRQWVGIHIDLEGQQIEYFDPAGSGSPDLWPFIHLRLYQVQDWMAAIDEDRFYPISPEHQPHHSPSSISVRQLWDRVSGGCFLPHYAYLRAKGISRREINGLAHLELNRQIHARHQEIRHRLYSSSSE